MFTYSYIAYIEGLSIFEGHPTFCVLAIPDLLNEYLYTVEKYRKHND